MIASAGRRHVRSGIILFALSLLLLSGCLQKSPLTRSAFVFGTLCTISLYDHYSEKLLNEAFDVMRQIEAAMSLYNETSYVRLINESAGNSPVLVTAEVFSVIQHGLAFSRLSDGAFDITVGPLVLLWGIGTENPNIPTQSEILGALSLINYKNLMLIKENGTVLLELKGMQIDLGGIAKGHAADKAADFLSEHGIKSALINFGGNIYTLGKKRDGTSWRIGIQHPAAERGRYVGIVEVTDAAVATSGKYERYFDSDGIRYHHILDTATGFPVDNGISSVTIVAESSMTADALSTAVFAMGLEKGFELVQGYEGVHGVILTEDKRIFVTDSLKARFRLIDNEYALQS